MSTSKNTSRPTKGMITSSTADEKNVQHHTDLGQAWWDPNGPLSTLHKLNAIRVPLIRDGILLANNIELNAVDPPSALKGFKILEVGCGGGFLTEDLARLQADITAIDVSQELIDVARQHASEMDSSLLNRITYKADSIENHSKENPGKYDAVILSEVVEHVDNVPQFVASCVDTIRPGGFVFITTPNRTVRSFFHVILMWEYVLKFIPKGTHDWNKFLTPREMEEMLKKLNCNTNLIQGWAYDKPNKSWKLAASTAVCYILAAIKQQ